MKTHILCSLTFFPESHIGYDIKSKNVVETDGPQMTSKYDAYTLHAGLVRLHARTHTHARARTHAYTDQ